jgi:trimethylamine--corrinoid protein Co-methyltransferase
MLPNDRLQPLTNDTLLQLHERTVHILEVTGMSFPSEKARDVFKHHGFRVEGETVFFTEELIQEALKTVPAEFTVLARNRNRSVKIGKENFVLGPSGGSPFILDYTGMAKTSTSKDCLDSIKVAHMLQDIDINRGLVVAGDIHSENFPLYHLLASIKLTDKPLDCISVEGTELLSLLFGVSRETMGEQMQEGITYALSYINPTSPLKLSEHESNRLIGLCQAGVALGISPMPMAGMTAPCTLPGLLLSQNCEIIGTIVLSQLVNPGCPVLYGCIGTITEMKNVSSPIGAPEARIIEFASAQLARFYNLPSRGDVGLTDANSVDFQAGAESAFHFANSVRSGIHLLPGLGAMGSWNIASLEKLVLDAEIAGYVKRLIRPLEFTEETMAIELIKKTGSHGSFISEPHTFGHFHKEFYSPTVFTRSAYETWVKDGKKDAFEKAHEKVEALLESYQAPDLDKSTERSLDNYAQDHYPVK